MSTTNGTAVGLNLIGTLPFETAARAEPLRLGMHFELTGGVAI
ncbi:hypothetical protein [uncultured Gimesia sp.]